MPRDNRYRSLYELGGDDQTSPVERMLLGLHDEIGVVEGDVQRATRTAASASRQVNDIIEMLSSKMAGVRQDITKVVEAINNLSTASHGNNRPLTDNAMTIDKLVALYKSLNAQIGSLIETDKGLQSSIAGLNQISKLNDEIMRTQVGSAARLQAEYKLLAIVWENMTEKERAANQQVMTLMNQKLAKYKEIEAQVKRASTGEAEQVSQMKGLAQIFEEAGFGVNGLDSAIRTLEADTKKVAQVQGLYNELLKTQEGSYDNLSTKYKIGKILHNAATDAQLEDNEKVLASLKQIHDQMNLNQQRTGKYTLQVGDYSKAMNGMRIATNQVVRELPVLANGVSMFAIAISNNIPILMDSIQATKREIAVKKEHRSELEALAASFLEAGNKEAAAAKMMEAESIKITSVWKALASSIFSWQTALVVVLAVLPGLIRAIEKKKKAQEEANKATIQAVDYEKELSKAYQEEGKQIGSDISKIDTLYHISQDLNRSYEDRIGAAKAMKKEFADEFAAYSEEEIVLGKAVKSYNKLRDSIIEVATARAYENKITELEGQRLSLQMMRDEAELAKQTAEAEKERLETLKNTESPLRALRQGGGYDPKAQGQREEDYEKAKQTIKKSEDTMKEADEQMQNIDNIVLKLRDNMPVGGIIKALFTGGDEDGKGETNIPDYYLQVLEATANLMEEGVEKELALLEVGWLKEQHGLNENLKALTDMRKGANKEELEEINNQIDNVVKLMNLGEEKYRQERMRVVNASLHEYEEVVEEEIDLDEEKRKSVERNLRQEQFERNQAYYREYELSQRTADDKEELNRRLLASEYEYWDKYLTKLREMGILLPHEYEKIMSELAKGQEKGRRRRNRFGGVVEAGMAMFSDWGRTDESTGQRVLKDEYKDFVSAVDNALKQSMSYMDEWMDKRLEMAEVAVEAAEKEMEAAKSALDYELEARNQGYANSVETARRELEIQKANHRKALEEKKKVEEEQRMIDVATQISSLVTATANIWSAMTHNTGIAGPILAAAATALMWGSFTAAQAKAAQVARSKQYGEGTVELLEGGSHASGHDIDMGVAKDGTRRRAEGGEFFAIINRRNSRKYRKIIPDVINSFNDGTFGEKYYNANAAMGEFALGLLAGGSPTDVSKLEKEVHAIREQGEVNRYTDSRGNVIVRYKNLTRKYKI